MASNTSTNNRESHNELACEAMAFQVLNQLSEMYESLGIDKTAADFKPDIIDHLVAAEADPNDIEDGFADRDVSNLEMMQLSCAYALGALASLDVAERENSWLGIAHAQYWMGVAFGIGFMKGFRKKALSERGSAGGLARSAKFEPLRQHARKLALARNYNSRLHAAMKLEEEVIAEAKRLGIEVKSETLYRRIYDWLKGMTFKRQQGKKN